MKEIGKSGLRRLGGGPSNKSSGASAVPAAQRTKLLYIEDNRDNWEVTELMLRRRFDLQWARNDAEACKALTESGHQFGAVLMDIELQGSNLSGIDLTKLVRGALTGTPLPDYARDVPVMRDLPIIFVTGYGARYTEPELIAHGGNRMLTKPVNFGELSMALSALAVDSSSGAGGIKRPNAGSAARIAHLLADNPRFHVHLVALAEAGLFAPQGYAGDLGALTTLLGKQGIEEAAIAISVLELAQARNEASAYLNALVYRRAIACQLVARRTAIADPQRATAVGFLLDAGLLVRATYDPAGALEIGVAPSSSRLSRERAGDEGEHPERMLDVARGWDLPEDIIEAVRSHHATEPPTAALARVAWVAERLAAVFENGDIVANNVAAMHAGKVVGLMTKDVEGLLDEIPARVRLLGDTTHVDLPEQTPYETVLRQGSPALTMMARAYRELEHSSEALVAEKAGMAARLSQANESIATLHRNDLALIAAVQSMLLPHESNIKNGRVQMSAFYRAAEDCGGDWWWYDETPNALRLFVGDVSGHGAGSAMVTGSVASACRLARELAPNLDAVSVLKLLHRELWSMARGQYHMTMLILEIPRDGSPVKLFSAAAPHVLAMSQEGKVTVAVTRGTPLGMPTDRFTVGTAELAAHPGMRFMCFTDGLYEFRTVQGQELGVKTLRRLLHESREHHGEEATKRIMRSVDALHPPDVPQEDDMTLVLVDIV